MKLIYGTNIWSHHQAPVAAELLKILGAEDFRMVLFEEVHTERRNMGWSEKPECSFIAGPPQSDKERVELYQKCVDADVLVVGSCPVEVMTERVALGKLTMIASERFFKKPFHRLRLFNPRYARGFARFRAAVNHPHVHALAIGHHAPDDLQTLKVFGEKVWRWGYFVEVSRELLPYRPSDPVKVLWVGRMLNWKRIDTLVKAFARLKTVHPGLTLTLVGDGPEKMRLQQLARRLALDSEFVRFLPSVSIEDVRRLMRESDIYVLSSDRHEGWGAVAGEAMSEGCVLIANEQAGASKELVIDGETGLLFRDGDDEHLAVLLERLCSDTRLRLRLRQQAWDRMQSLWHPRVAAERLVTLINGILSGTPPEYSDGPCSHFVPADKRNIKVNTYE